MFDTAESAGLWFDIFNGVLLFGAFLVFVGTWGTIKTSSIKERFSDERVISNEAETKRAVADSDAAKEGTAKAAERIAELSTQAEELRNRTAEANARASEAQLALEKFKAPRSISSEQKSIMVETLRGFAGQKFDMAVNSGDPEAGLLLNAIEGVLLDAGWEQIDWKGGDLVFTRPSRKVVGLISMIGVFVQIEKNKIEPFEAAAVTLAGSLSLEGIIAKAEAGEVPSADNKDVMHIMVGRKP